MKDVVIVSMARTPIGSFGGALASISAPQLGAHAIKHALQKIKLDPQEVQEVLMGNVLQANEGQAPARQAALAAGLSHNIPCTTVNKVCSSGLKALMQATQAIRCGDAEVIVAGGMESMSNVPHYLQGRNGQKLGDIKMTDGLLRDGLLDVYNKTHMGNCAELCARDMTFSREAQDEFAMESYRRSAKATEEGRFKGEIAPVEVPQRKGDPLLVDHDEDVYKVKFEKVPQLKPVFDKEGSVTAANASNINDGAAALVVMSAEKAQALGLEPLARVTSYADAAHEPEWFTTAPAKAVPKALDKAGLTKDQVDAFELNEAFSVVGLANIKLLDIDPAKTNVNGGAVSIGHPLGCSGARIIMSLISVLQQNKSRYGAAGICNGGGGASAMVIENLR
ncbi:MAG: acetyl-CoA C-acyltransferase [Schleiferiaceae bacterium]|nr:acetyl-CoA C-acyltransferase [Schleiferiaceae bacterium]